MPDRIETQVRTSPARESFLALAHRTFGLNFAPWDAQGYWTDRYRPYALVRDGRVLANVSVNTIDTRVGGETLRCIQLGTVMTDPACRMQGLARRAMEAALHDCADADMIYLYGNDFARDFYPKFGFAPAQEYIHHAAIAPTAGDFASLDMTAPADVALLRARYAQGNPYSAAQMIHNFELLMFYCGAPLKQNVFYSARRDVVCIAEQDGQTLTLHDIFGAKNGDLLEILAEIAASDTAQVTLGFTPTDARGFVCEALHEEDCTLFVLRGKRNLFAEGRLRMPSLSHA